MTMLSGDRVGAHTAAEVNARIDQAICERLFFYAEQPEAAIASRLEALEHEWDIERFALKALRGDFEAVGAASNTTERANAALQSVLK